MLLRLYQFGEQGQRALAVAQHRYVRRHVLADFGGVHVEMDDLRLPCIRFELSRHAVVKAHSYSYQHVAFVGFHVGPQVAVHAQHPLVQPVSARQGRKSQQGASARHVALFYKRPELFLRVAQLHALAHEHQRLLRLVDEAHGFGHHLRVGFGIGVVAPDKVEVNRLVFGHFSLRILREVEHHRSRPSAPRDIECPGHRPCHILARRIW